MINETLILNGKLNRFISMREAEKIKLETMETIKTQKKE